MSISKLSLVYLFLHSSTVSSFASFLCTGYQRAIKYSHFIKMPSDFLHILLLQIYNEYVQATEALNAEKEENRRLQSYMGQIVQVCYSR